MTKLYRTLQNPRNLLTTTLLLVAVSARAQHYPHVTLWTRLGLVKRWSPRWETALDLNYRRQSDPHVSALVPVSAPLLTGTRLWVNYRPSERLVLQVNPLTYFASNQLLGREEDYQVGQNREWRLAVGAEFSQRLGPRWLLRERVQDELRFLRSNQDRPISRARFRVMARYDLAPKWGLNLFDELFLHVPPQRNHEPVGLSQNWLGVLFVHALTPRLNLEIGYTYVLTRRRSLIEFDDQHALNLGLQWRLPE